MHGVPAGPGGSCGGLMMSSGDSRVLKVQSQARARCPWSGAVAAVRSDPAGGGGSPQARTASSWLSRVARAGAMPL
jgi:hypothetical protein